MSDFAIGPPSPPKDVVISSDISMMFYGFVIVGVSIALLSVYHFIILKLFAIYHQNHHLTQHRQHQHQHTHSAESSSSSSTSSGDLNSITIEGGESNKKMNNNKKKEVELIRHDSTDLTGFGNECAVCLSVFEEGEVVQQLPRCKHCFHADCIDLWLYSHLDCPICRTPVGLLQVDCGGITDRNCSNNNRDDERSRRSLQQVEVSLDLP